MEEYRTTQSQAYDGTQLSSTVHKVKKVGNVARGVQYPAYTD